MKRKEKPWWKRLRAPLPMQTGGLHGPKKGLRGYDRKRAKQELHREVTDGRSIRDRTT